MEVIYKKSTKKWERNNPMETTLLKVENHCCTSLAWSWPSSGLRWWRLCRDDWDLSSQFVAQTFDVYGLVQSTHTLAWKGEIKFSMLKLIKQWTVDEWFEQLTEWIPGTGVQFMAYFCTFCLVFGAKAQKTTTLILDFGLRSKTGPEFGQSALLGDHHI